MTVVRIRVHATFSVRVVVDGGAPAGDYEVPQRDVAGIINRHTIRGRVCLIEGGSTGRIIAGEGHRIPRRPAGSASRPKIHIFVKCCAIGQMNRISRRTASDGISNCFPRRRPVRSRVGIIASGADVVVGGQRRKSEKQENVG